MVITAAAKSDPEVTASCKVTVKRLPDSIDIEPVGGHIPYGDNTVLVYIPYGDGERTSVTAATTASPSTSPRTTNTCSLT